MVEEGPTAGMRHTVAVGVTIGREGCEITLADPEVSRRHARIGSLDDALAIEDLGSANGTYVNGRKLSGVAELKDGDAVKMGNSSLRVEARAEHGATRLTPSPPSQATKLGGQVRGDVPQPPPASASRVHHTLNPARQPVHRTFDAAPTTKSRRGSAATRVEATVLSYAAVVATAVAVVLYVLAEKV